MVHAEGIEPPDLSEVLGYSQPDAIVYNVQNGGKWTNRTPMPKHTSGFKPDRPPLTGTFLNGGEPGSQTQPTFRLYGLANRCINRPARSP